MLSKIQWTAFCFCLNACLPCCDTVSKKDCCPCCLGKCSYNVLIQAFHIQQMVILAVHSFWFLWAWVLNTSFSANHFLTSKWILMWHELFPVFGITFSEHWHLQTLFWDLYFWSSVEKASPLQCCLILHMGAEE